MTSLLVKGQGENTTTKIPENMFEDIWIGINEDGSVQLFWHSPSTREEAGKVVASVDESSDSSGEFSTAYVQRHSIHGGHDRLVAKFCRCGASRSHILGMIGV